MLVFVVAPIVVVVVLGRNCPEVGRRMHLDVPWLIEEFELASLQAFCEPALRGVVEDGEAVEEGDPVLGKCVEVLRERIVYASVDVVRDGDGEEDGDDDEHEQRAASGACVADPWAC